ncbi:MAG TPA: DUF6335 family protein [Nitrospira sp.]|nr:DUF6335 family protein [Nitrospira sp.]
MATEKDPKVQEDRDEIEMTVDSYTGELKPVAEDADQFIEVIPEETDDRDGSNYLLNEETSMDSYAANADADAVAEQIAHYTEDEDVEEDFAERQRLAVGGRDELREELDEHNSLSPQITGGDLDASWQTGNQAGEETVGGSVSTPDQDIVEELGEAAGLTYRDDEPLDYSKINERDRNRWELNPASALDDDEPSEDDLEGDDDEDLEDEDLDELEELDELDEEEDENLEDDELDDGELEDELDDEDLDDESVEDEDDK